MANRPYAGIYYFKNEKIHKRELKSFVKAKKELNIGAVCKVITFDDSKVIEYDGCKIEIVNILEYLPK